jgi:hypothetical protein
LPWSCGQGFAGGTNSERHLALCDAANPLIANGRAVRVRGEVFIMPLQIM